MTRSLALLACAALGLSACKGSETAATDGAANSAQAAKPAGNLAELLSSREHARLLGLVRAAGLEETLRGPGPYTVLVPSDQALAAVPQPAAGQALAPEAKARLTRQLTYHVLPGVILSADIGRAIDNAGGGKAVLATMAGPTLTATRKGTGILLTDAAGRTATVTAADQQAANGVVHRIDGLLEPGEAAAAGGR